MISSSSNGQSRVAERNDADDWLVKKILGIDYGSFLYRRNEEAYPENKSKVVHGQIWTFGKFENFVTNISEQARDRK